MELIKIYQGNLIDARELHQFLDSKQDFSNWITNRIKKYGFEDGKDFSINLLKSQGGRPSKEYYLTLNMAKELAMVENNPKGREARRYFIEAEKTLSELKQNKRLEAFLKLETTKDKLHQNVVKLGGNKADYIQIDTSGSKVFFNGQVIKDEVLNTLALKARDFATEITNDILSKDKNILEDVEDINKEQHGAVRNFLIDQTGQKPEDLPREKDIKKLGE